MNECVPILMKREHSPTVINGEVRPCQRDEVPFHLIPRVGQGFGHREEGEGYPEVVCFVAQHHTHRHTDVKLTASLKVGVCFSSSHLEEEGEGEGKVF